MANEQDSLVFALDIGTSKVVAAVGEAQADGGLRLLGRGNVPTDGLEGGVVIDIEAAASSVERALREAEAQAGQG